MYFFINLCISVSYFSNKINKYQIYQFYRFYLTFYILSILLILWYIFNHIYFWIFFSSYMYSFVHHILIWTYILCFIDAYLALDLNFS